MRERATTPLMWVVATAAVALAVLFTGSVAAVPVEIFERYGDGGREFEEALIGDLLVYYHVRTIGDALVEHDYIVYQFETDTGAFLARKSHWRDDLPERLPASMISRERAESLVDGEIRSSRLIIIDPDSYVFPLEPAPANPCWVVTTIGDRGLLELTVVDAVEGTVLGPGIPPPSKGYSLTGPQDFNPCYGSWGAWASGAEMWFETMGYPTELTTWPTLSQVEHAVGSELVAVFYELAHGWYEGFTTGCEDGNWGEYTSYEEIGTWIADYTKMPFAFLGSCGGLCETGDGTISHEFRKGSFEGTATVGYCDMDQEFCDECWLNSIGWQTAFFEYASQGWTIKAAHDQANADYPMCGVPECMRFAGDETLTIVPLVWRAGVVWSTVDDPDVQDSGRGAGAAWGDYDGDADLDLYLANFDGANRFLRNDGGDFVDATIPPLDDAGAGTGVAWGDYDNDGDLDLYLGNSDGANRLFRNDEGTFVDAATGAVADTGVTYGVAWVDYDLDGDLDLYVANAGPNTLLRNEGAPTWAFTDATTPLLAGDSTTRGVAWGDYDNDGDSDLYVVNRFADNLLLANLGDGTFEDVTDPSLAAAGHGSGASWADYDNDGDLDVFVANVFGTNRLFRNDGVGAFSEVTAYPLSSDGGGAGASWADYDNDGDLDIYVAFQTAENHLFVNDGPPDWGFTEGTSGELGNDGAAWGVTWGDYDLDGDLDLYVTNDGPNVLFENMGVGGRHWLTLRLVGTASNRSAIGSRVRVVAGGASMIREVTAGSGHLSANSLEVEFGLGASTVVETLEVRWPSGLVERATGVAVNQVLEVIEGMLSTGVAEGEAVAGEVVLRGNFPNPFNPVTMIRYELPASTNVSLAVYDLTGRRVRVLVDSEVRVGGRHTVPWDGRDDRGRHVGSGVYFYRLEADGGSHERTMILLK